ncbi:MAG: hypothetical protein COV36_06720 [Alphaproteobacteria bacterium CG11_big_fil_rev_8_21_14_0_20_44_7]|nr:MAG: hypothetical protein COV36_06720 [Alphaproteobacteria bacterium CG11_big_fil_rev_8_21_14_0_20_44_7]
MKKTEIIFAIIGYLVLSIIALNLLALFLRIFFEAEQAMSISLNIIIGIWASFALAYCISFLIPREKRDNKSIIINADIDTVWKIMTDLKTEEKLARKQEVKVRIINDKFGEEEWETVCNDSNGYFVLLMQTTGKIKHKIWSMDIISSKNVIKISPEETALTGESEIVDENFLMGSCAYEFIDLQGKTKALSYSIFKDNSPRFVLLITSFLLLFISPAKKDLKKHKDYIEGLCTKA